MTPTLKIFWNGIKVENAWGNPIEASNKLIKGHWSYQRRDDSRGLVERLRFYFKGYDPRSSDVAVAMGGKGTFCGIDDTHRDAHFEVVRGDSLWFAVVDAYAKQENRMADRIERKATKSGMVNDSVASIRAKAVALTASCKPMGLAEAEEAERSEKAVHLPGPVKLVFMLNADLTSEVRDRAKNLLLEALVSRQDDRNWLTPDDYNLAMSLIKGTRYEPMTASEQQAVSDEFRSGSYPQLRIV